MRFDVPSNVLESKIVFIFSTQLCTGSASLASNLPFITFLLFPHSVVALKNWPAEFHAAKEKKLMMADNIIIMVVKKKKVKNYKA